MKVETGCCFNTDRTDLEWKNQCDMANSQTKIQQVMTPNTSNTKDAKKSFERDGDWTCQRCQNLNFSFRYACNKCNLSHEASQSMQNIYNNEKGYKLAAQPFYP